MEWFSKESTQHLRVRNFYGTSKGVVKTTMSIAISALTLALTETMHQIPRS